ncbi:MAG: threonine/serine dehydratase [Calditrichaeota bacterium]|nr:MAG: threonine/serine dehydratase [Calditrichota bacterium]
MPTFQDILDAHERITPYIHRTPVYTSRYINGLCGAQVFFKCENLQKTGSFKIRGATNAVFTLTEEEAQKGVITHSSGNHGAALAQAARWRGIRCYVVMPHNAPAIKKQAARGYGAEIVYSEATLDSREAVARELIEKHGLSLIHPYDNPAVIAGQATAGRELLEETGGLDALLVPAGGGGILSGSAILAKEGPHRMSVYGAEPSLADDAYQSLKTGVRQPQRPPVTVADGLRTALSDRTFNIIRSYVDDIILVDDDEIVAAMRLVWERMKLIIEPSSAAPLAALLKSGKRFAGKKVGIVFSGGNVDLDHLPWLK